MISFACPECGKELTVKEDLVGKRRRCPFCKTKMAVPAPPGNEQQQLVGLRVPEGAKTVTPASDDVKTLLPQNKPGGGAKTLEQVASPSAKKPELDGKTLLGGAPGLKPIRNLDDTVSPDGPVPKDRNAELTKFLQPPQQPDELGRLGKYRVIKVLGAGGMGVVFEAEDSVLKRRVALKALLPGICSSADARERFLREAQSSAALQHDNVVTVHDVSEANDVPFLAMQLLQGEALDTRLAREPILPMSEVLRIGREAAEGLAAAHERGMVHRDIKPANLFLEAPKGRVKILDFGLARPTGESKLTQFGTIVGTPGYLSPEQASGKPVDARGDLFSLGCVLYRLTTGELPFKGEDMLAMLTALVTTHPTAPNQVNPDVPAPLSDLIMRMLSRDRDRRPPWAREVANTLDSIGAQPTPSSAPSLTLVEDDEEEPLLLLPASDIRPAAAERREVKTEEMESPRAARRKTRSQPGSLAPAPRRRGQPRPPIAPKKDVFHLDGVDGGRYRAVPHPRRNRALFRPAQQGQLDQGGRRERGQHETERR